MIREKIILNYIKRKDVLDIGSHGQSQKYYLWDLIKKYAKTLTGIDIRLSDDNNIVCGNMETYSFRKKFDVIIAGDVIEHTSNQGLFLDNIHKHLKNDGFLILTTPNCKWFTVILKPNPTHTLWHDKYTLRYLLKRHNFKIAQFQYYPGNKPYYDYLRRILTKRQGLLVICQKQD